MWLLAPTPAQLQQVPPSQLQDASKNIVTLTSGKKREHHVDMMVKGLESIIHYRDVSQSAFEDLTACISLIANRKPIPFQWNTDMYMRSSPRLRQKNLALLPDAPPREDSDNDDNEHDPDMDDDGTFAPTDMAIEQVRLAVTVNDADATDDWNWAICRCQ